MLVDHHTHVGCALNVGLAAQRVHAAAGDADVAKQKLHHAHCARVLRAIGVLRLAQGVQHRAGTAGLSGGGIGGIDQLEGLFVHAAHAAYGVEIVARVVLLELLVNAHRILQGHVALGMLQRGRGEFRHAFAGNPGIVARRSGVPFLFRFGLIMPAMGGIRLRLLIPAAEQARCGIEFILGVEQIACIGVVEQVLEVVLVHVARFLVLRQVGLDEMLNDVVVHAAVEGDVRAGANGAINVRLLGSASVARVDDDPLGALLVGLFKPQRAHGVVLDGVRAAIQNNIGVLEVTPVARHGATTK